MYRSCNTVSKRHQEDQKTKFQKEQLGLSREQRLQYSCLENPMDGGAWKAAVHGVTKSRTRLNDFTFTFLFPELGRKWQPTPVFLPGESHGRRSLEGYSSWGRKESDTTERLHFFPSLLSCAVAQSIVWLFSAILDKGMRRDMN